jgi:hypothetical protein
MAGVLTVCQNGKGGNEEILSKIYNYYQTRNMQRSWLLSCVVNRGIEKEFVENPQFE